MTFQLRLNSKRILKRSSDGFDLINLLRSKLEAALLHINNAEHTENKYGTIAVACMYALRGEIYSTDIKYREFQRLCRQKKVRTKGRQDDDFAPILSLFAGHKAKSTRSRWKGALEYGTWKNLDPETFEELVTEKGVVACSKEWFKHVSPERKKLADKVNETFVREHKLSAEDVNPHILKALKKSEGECAVLLQSMNGEVVQFKVRPFTPNDFKRFIIINK